MSLTCGMMFRQRYEDVGLPCRKDDGIAFAHVYIAHLGVEDGYTLSWKWIGGCHLVLLLKLLTIFNNMRGSAPSVCGPVVDTAIW